jgi:hypothetical protein
VKALKALLRFYTHFGAGFIAGALLASTVATAAQVSPSFLHLAHTMIASRFHG